MKTSAPRQIRAAHRQPATPRHEERLASAAAPAHAREAAQRQCIDGGFGSRLTALVGDGDRFTPTDRFDNENHGTKPWPVSIAPFLGDLVPLVQTTGEAAGPLKHLTDNLGQVGAPHDVVVDVDWYRHREHTRSDFGFHKDSRDSAWEPHAHVKNNGFAAFAHPKRDK